MTSGFTGFKNLTQTAQGTSAWHPSYAKGTAWALQFGTTCRACPGEQW